MDKKEYSLKLTMYVLIALFAFASLGAVSYTWLMFPYEEFNYGTINSTSAGTAHKTDRSYTYGSLACQSRTGTTNLLVSLQCRSTDNEAYTSIFDHTITTLTNTLRVDFETGACDDFRTLCYSGCGLTNSLYNCTGIWGGQK